MTTCRGGDEEPRRTSEKGVFSPERLSNTKFNKSLEQNPIACSIIYAGDKKMQLPNVLTDLEEFWDKLPEQCGTTWDEKLQTYCQIVAAIPDNPDESDIWKAASQISNLFPNEICALKVQSGATRDHARLSQSSNKALGETELAPHQVHQRFCDLRDKSKQPSQKRGKAVEPRQSDGASNE